MLFKGSHKPIGDDVQLPTAASGKIRIALVIYESPPEPEELASGVRQALFSGDGGRW